MTHLGFPKIFQRWIWYFNRSQLILLVFVGFYWNYWTHLAPGVSRTLFPKNIPVLVGIFMDPISIYRYYWFSLDSVWTKELLNSLGIRGVKDGVSRDDPSVVHKDRDRTDLESQKIIEKRTLPWYTLTLFAWNNCGCASFITWRTVCFEKKKNPVLIYAQIISTNGF